MRLQLQPTLPARVSELSPAQRQALGTLGNGCRPTWTAIPCSHRVWDWRQNFRCRQKSCFEAIYIAFLDQPRGPRVGWFLSSLDFAFVQARLQEAAA